MMFQYGDLTQILSLIPAKMIETTIKSTVLWDWWNNQGLSGFQDFIWLNCSTKLLLIYNILCNGKCFEISNFTEIFFDFWAKRFCRIFLFVKTFCWYFCSEKMMHEFKLKKFRKITWLQFIQNIDWLKLATKFWLNNNKFYDLICNMEIFTHIFLSLIAANKQRSIFYNTETYGRNNLLWCLCWQQPLLWH